MELSMSDNDTNDFENAVGAAVTRVPPIITAIIAVGGLVAADRKSTRLNSSH